MNDLDVIARMEDVLVYAHKVVKEHPQLKVEVQDLLGLCQCEIEQGESAEHEIDLCWNDIDILVKEIND